MEAKSILVAAMVAIIGSLVMTGTARADWQEKQKLTDPNIEANDRFGYSASISGDYAIVGAIDGDIDSPLQEDTGSAYVFYFDGLNWIQQAKLTASDAAPADKFGSSVSIDGDYAIVGAYYDDDNEDNSGSAYVFKRNGTDWIEQAKLVASDGTFGDRFGTSVSISGDYAVVGASGDDPCGTNSGSAYIFKRDTDPNWVEQAKLTASDGAGGAVFGRSVSISGDYVIVGAANHNDDGKWAGAAYIFRRFGDPNWLQQDKLTPSDPEPGDSFGSSVSISGYYAIVGAHGDDDNGGNSGSAYIFKRSGVDWIKQAKLIASDGAKLDQFGLAVSINGDYAIIGAFGNDTNGSNSGAAYIFGPNEVDPNNWTQDNKLTASDGESSDHFGVSVAIDGEYAIVGAHSSNSAYVFQKVICPTGDFNGSCGVDFVDYSIFALAWLTKEGQDEYNPNCNISIPAYDSIDWMDFIVFTDNWLIGTQ